MREEQGPETSSWCKQLESSTKYRKQLLQYWVKAEQDYNPQEKKTKWGEPYHKPGFLCEGNL